jgi:phosphoesterase RecJ-like protein
VFFKENGSNDWRISMRSKGDVDTQAIAKQYGGGGHKNASGCSARGAYDVLQRRFEQHLKEAIERATTIQSR